MALSARTPNYKIPMAELTDKYTATDINQVAEKVDEVIKEIDDAMATKASTLTTRINDVDTALNVRIDDAIRDHDDDIGLVTGEIADINASLRTMTTRVDDIEDDLGNFTGIGATLATRVHDLEHNVGTNSASILDFQQRIQTIQQALDKLKDDIGGAGSADLSGCVLMDDGTLTKKNTQCVLFKPTVHTNTGAPATSAIQIIDDGGDGTTAPAVTFVANTPEGWGNYTTQLYADRAKRRMIIREYDYTHQVTADENGNLPENVSRETFIDPQTGVAREASVYTREIAYKDNEFHDGTAVFYRNAIAGSGSVPNQVHIKCPHNSDYNFAGIKFITTDDESEWIDMHVLASQPGKILSTRVNAEEGTVNDRIAFISDIPSSQAMAGVYLMEFTQTKDNFMFSISSGKKEYLIVTNGTDILHCIVETTMSPRTSYLTILGGTNFCNLSVDNNVFKLACTPSTKILQINLN